jgi:hypothetical protein
MEIIIKNKSICTRVQVFAAARNTWLFETKNKNKYEN